MLLKDCPRNRQDNNGCCCVNETLCKFVDTVSPDGVCQIVPVYLCSDE